MRQILLLLLTSCFATGVHASQIYSCTNSDGTRSYTSAPTVDNKCEERSYFDKPEKKSPQSSKTITLPNKATQTTKAQPSKKIIIDKKVQEKRDEKRSEILIYELKQEIKQKNFFAKKISTTDTAEAELLNYLEDNLRVHTQNVISIKQELERLGFKVTLSEDTNS